MPYSALLRKQETQTMPFPPRAAPHRRCQRPVFSHTSHPTAPPNNRERQSHGSPFGKTRHWLSGRRVRSTESQFCLHSNTGLDVVTTIWP